VLDEVSAAIPGDASRRESPRISREHVGKLACLRAQSTAAAGCEARSAEQPADGNPRRLSRTQSVLDNGKLTDFENAQRLRNPCAALGSAAFLSF
jgi:hypothetical protein